MLRAPLLVAWLPLLAAAQSLPETPSLPPVGVFMIFDSTPGLASLDLMKSEVNQLFQPSGLSLDWRLAKDNHGDQSFAGLVVLKFRGSCQADGFQLPYSGFGSAGESFTLGSTVVSHGRVLPYGEVQCDQIRKALAFLPPGSNQKDRQRALARALARVVAHELYHMLAATTTHAEHGITKASQSLQELVSDHEFRFREEDTRAIGSAFVK